MFPALIALVSIVGLFGDPEATTDALNDIVSDLGPASAADTFRGPIESITASRGTAGVLFFAGLAGAIWAASGYVGAFMRASNVIYEVDEGRPFWKLRPLQIVVTLAMVLLAALTSLALVLSGPLGHLGRGGRGAERQRDRPLPAGEVAGARARAAGHDLAALLRLAERPRARASAGSRPAACWPWESG